VLISRKRYKIATYVHVQWKTKGKSYVAYRMLPVLVTLNDLEGHFPRSFPVCRPLQVQSVEHFAVFYQISTDIALARSLSDSWASRYNCCDVAYLKFKFPCDKTTGCLRTIHFLEGRIASSIRCMNSAFHKV